MRRVLKQSNSLLSSIGILVLSMVLTACGGSSESGPSSPADPVGAQTLTGVFIDSAVEGIGFRTSTQEGMTNAAGEFVYVDGESVTFFIGSFEFPAVVAGETITPLDIAGTDDPNDQTALNIARLLQSIDSNGDVDDGITISEGAAAAAAEIVEVDFAADGAAFGAAVANFVGGAGGQLVTEEDALDHLNNSLLRLALEGATLLDVGTENGVNYHMAITLRPDGEIEDVNDDNFSEPYDAESNSHRANIWIGTWSLDGDQICTIDDEEDCWYMALLGNNILSYTDEAKTNLVFTDTIAEHIDAEKLPGKYRLTINGFDDECNLQVVCHFEFSADGAFTEWEFDEVDQTSTWVIDDDGNMRMDWYEVDGTQRGVLRFYMKNAVGTDSYEEFDMVIYADLWDEPFPVMLSATLIRVE